MNDANQALNALIDAEKAEGAALASRQAADAVLADALAERARAQALVDALRAEQASLPTLSAAKKEIAPIAAAASEAREAFGQMQATLKGAAINGLSASEYDKLSREFFAALKAHLDAEARLADASSKLEALRDRLEQLRGEATKARGAVQEAEAKVKEAAAAAKAAAATVAESDQAVDQALEALGAALSKLNEEAPGPAPISPEILAVISGANRDRRRDFLTIPSSIDSLDAMVRKTLARFHAEIEKEMPADAARGALVRNGVATRIAQVTNRLARKRLSPMRKAVLSRSYVPLLMGRLGEPIDPKVARDSVGLADLLIHDLDAAGGPLHRYCDILADAAITEMRIDAPAGSAQRQLITAQLLGSI